MKFISLPDDKFVFRMNKKYSKKQFLKKCDVNKGTFGEIFALEIYNKMFEDAIDVIAEYKKYYSDEYDSIQEFLFWRYCIPFETLDEIFSESGRSSYIGIFSDYSLHLEEENEFSRAFKDLFEKLGKR